MTSCNGQKEANTNKTVPDPEMMQSAEEHQEITTEDEAVMPVGEPRKQHIWLWRAAGKGRIGPGEITDLGVAWGNRNIVRNNCTQNYCGPCKELATARIRTSHCA
jgi:hypothetical protein